MSKHQFKSEVTQLLHLIIHSLYSNREIFLRELVSNASDALDRLKYLTLTDEAYKQLAFDPRIDITYDDKAGTLTVADNGIGMGREELEENLGTIAQSGTRRFVESIKDAKQADVSLIGQFGVGFYSAFMVAERIEVVSRRAGAENAFRWASDGQGEFEITEASRDSHGTTITLHLNQDGREFADRWRIEGIIKKYSNHVPFPIHLRYEEPSYKDGKEEFREVKTAQINAASALWRMPKSKLTDADYNEFYKTLSHDSDDPLLHIHTQAEGKLEYSTLFYVPQRAPVDLHWASYRSGVKLYIRRVFITDDAKELMPSYLRFVRGVIDSEDLPLNVSREMLQHNLILSRIRTASAKKILSELDQLKNKDREKHQSFIAEFGPLLKEGLYQDRENREALLELMLYKSTTAEGQTTLDEYAKRMKPDQKEIFYIAGRGEEALRGSPLLEMYRAKGIEVLLMDSDIDEIVMTSVDKYKDHEFRSVNRADATDSLKNDADREKEKGLEPVIAKVRRALGDRVKDVRASSRLADSPSCLVADEKDPTIGMQQILKAMGQKNIGDFKAILEINPDHQIVKRLEAIDDQAVIDDISHLLLEQAMLVEGLELKNPGAFVARLNRVISKGL